MRVLYISKDKFESMVSWFFDFIFSMHVIESKEFSLIKQKDKTVNIFVRSNHFFFKRNVENEELQNDDAK